MLVVGRGSQIRRWPFRRWVLSGLAMAGTSVVLDGQAAVVGCGGSVAPSNSDAGCGAMSEPPCAAHVDACAAPPQDACAVIVRDACGTVTPCAAMIDGNFCAAVDACPAMLDVELPGDSGVPDASQPDAPLPDAAKPADAGG